MLTRTVVTTGAVTVVDASSTTQTAAPPTVVGDAPQWADASDSTYAELETFEHPDVSHADNGVAFLVPNTAVHPNPVGATVTARVRYQSMDPDMAPPRVRVKDAANAEYLLESGNPAPPGSASPAWIDLPLTESTPFRLDQFLQRTSSGSTTLVVEVYAPFLRTYVLRYPRTRIFEVELLVRTVGGDAPPCRLIRDDTHALGGARLFPPPKSRQRSSRGVGYY